MKPPNIVTVHFLSAKWSKKLFTINHYELQNGKCIVTQELSAYPTSALDEESIRCLQAYLNEIKKDKIIILISHNSDFISISDEIVDLDKLDMDV